MKSLHLEVVSLMFALVAMLCALEGERVLTPLWLCAAFLVLINDALRQILGELRK